MISISGSPTTFTRPRYPTGTSTEAKLPVTLDALRKDTASPNWKMWPP